MEKKLTTSFLLLSLLAVSCAQVQSRARPHTGAPRHVLMVIQQLRSQTHHLLTLYVQSGRLSETMREMLSGETHPNLTSTMNALIPPTQTNVSIHHRCAKSLCLQRAFFSELREVLQGVYCHELLCSGLLGGPVLRPTTFHQEIKAFIEAHLDQVTAMLAGLRPHLDPHLSQVHNVTQSLQNTCADEPSDVNKLQMDAFAYVALSDLSQVLEAWERGVGECQ